MTEAKVQTKYAHLSELEYIRLRYKECDIVKEREAKDAGTKFWDGVSLYPEQAAKHPCRFCTEDNRLYALATKAQREKFRPGCVPGCLWFPRAAELRALM
ncbi:Hypothetical protein POVN_LOCUS252 [uncultured virus]|nr:Hypothetical protein POVN_LOCUS252 [uncultured virus]